MMSRGVVWRRRLLGAIASGMLISVNAIGITQSLASEKAPATVAQKLHDISNIWGKLATNPNERVRVIIQFAEPMVPAAGTFSDASAADAAVTKAIHAAQDRILSAVLSNGSASAASASEHNLVRMSFTPQFAISVTAEELKKFADNPSVVGVYEDFEMHPMLDASLPLIQMPQMYSAGHQGTGYTVAVIDSGARRSHESITPGRVVSAACFNTGTTAANSRCPGGVPQLVAAHAGEDCVEGTFGGCGHGTHVTGTAMGYNTNRQAGEPASGVARVSRLISINTFNKSGSTSFSDVNLGLEHVYSLRNTYNIAAVNLSIGVYNNPQYSNCDSSMNSMKVIIDRLRSVNIATVIAAGNDGFNSAVSIPSCISTAITVASSTTSRASMFSPPQGPDQRTTSSNWGNLIDIAAPGHVIYAAGSNGDSWYTNKSGTSMAAPHVTGAWAALRSAHPNASVSQILSALQSTGTNITAAGVTKPRINVNSARVALGGGTPPPTGPANDNFANRIAVAVPAQGSTRTVTGTNVGSSAEAGEPIHAGRSGARTSVWWRYTPATSGTITIDTVGSGFDTVLAVYTGSSVGGLSSIASNDDEVGLQSRVTFSGTAGVQYQIAVAGFNNATGAITLNVQGGSAAPVAPANDNFGARVMIPPHGAINGPRVQRGTTNYATRQAGEPLHVNRPVATNSVWWRYTPATSGRISIDTKGSNFNTVLAVYTGSSVRTLSLVAWNDDAPDLGRRSRVVFQGVAGTQYQIAVAGGFGNNSGRIRMTLRGGGRYVVSGAGEVAGVSSLATPHHQAMQAAMPANAGPANAGPANAGLFAAAAPAANVGQPVADTARQTTTVPGLPATGAAIGLGAGSSAQTVDRKLPASVNGSSTAPVELLSTVVTASDDGVLRIPAAGSGFAIVAVNNLGARATLQASLSTEGSAATPAPAGLSICRTNSETGECLGARGTTVTFAAEPGELVTFAVHAASVGAAIPLDLSANRLHVHFRQGATTVGTASMPVCTTGAAGCEAADSAKQSAELMIAR